MKGPGVPRLLTHLYKLQHGLLQTLPFALEFFVRRGGRHAVWTAEDDAHRGKRPGKNEPVPALNPPRARIFHINRHDFRARLLGEKNDALSEFIGRAARSVGRDDDVPAVRDDFCELSNGAGAFAGTGTLTTSKSKRSTRSASSAPSRLELMRAAPCRSGR